MTRMLIDATEWTSASSDALVNPDMVHDRVPMVSRGYGHRDSGNSGVISRSTELRERRGAPRRLAHEGHRALRDGATRT
jgi:hypothetical protein